MGAQGQEVQAGSTPQPRLVEVGSRAVSFEPMVD